MNWKPQLDPNNLIKQWKINLILNNDDNDDNDNNDNNYKYTYHFENSFWINN